MHTKLRHPNKSLKNVVPKVHNGLVRLLVTLKNHRPGFPPQSVLMDSKRWEGAGTKGGNLDGEDFRSKKKAENVAVSNAAVDLLQLHREKNIP
ncbi:hypothetical protein BgiMline_004601 [Biomphalaria glabrata]|nr:hypothetical protein BgiMline_002706 [Biomphalaria glabrata]